MYMDNITKYIYAGLLILPTKLFYVSRRRIKHNLRGFSVLPLCICWIGLIPGVILGGYWLVIAASMLILALAVIIAVAVLTIHDMTVQKRLIMQTLVFLAMALFVPLVQMLCFSVVYGFNVFLLCIYIPVLLIPLLAGMKYAKVMRKDEPYEPSGIRDTTLSYIGYVSGIVGTGLVIYLLKSTGRYTILLYLVFICAVLSSILLPFGLLSIQRLYYLSKLEKMGITLEDPVPPRYEID